MKLRHLLALLILIIPTLTSLMHPGYWGASDELHIAWLQQMDAAVQAGKFPLRYVPDLSYGFGYPLFNFVFPLPFYLGEAFHLLGFSFVISIKLVFLVSLLGSAAAMYFLARQLAVPAVSVLAAAIYAYTPYRSTDIYVRGAVGEAFAFIFLPLLTVSLLKVSQGRGRRWIGLGALSLAGLILSHDITAYMFVPFALLLALVLHRRLSHLLSLFLLGLGVSVYFWLPALKDSLLMQHDTVFNYWDHFPNLSRLIRPYWGYGASLPTPTGGMSFYLGTPNLIVLAISLLVFVLLRRRFDALWQRWFTWVYFSFLAAAFMMNHYSTILWKYLPLLPYFQFPWRFLVVSAFATALMALAVNKLRFSKPLAIGLTLATVLLNSSVFIPQDFLNRSDDYYLSRYVPVPRPSFAYTQLQEEYLRLPKSTSVRPDRLYPRVFSSSSSAFTVDILNSFDARITTTSSVPLELNYNKYYFPGWTGRLDGSSLDLRSGQPFGQISFTVPAGSHHITISYSETVLNTVLDLVSAGLLIVSLFFVFKP